MMKSLNKCNNLKNKIKKMSQKILIVKSHKKSKEINMIQKMPRLFTRMKMTNQTMKLFKKKI